MTQINLPTKQRQTQRVTENRLVAKEWMGEGWVGSLRLLTANYYIKNE